jgi:hypothetical protein
LRFFLQGRAAMLHALLDLLRYAMDQQTYAGIPDSRPSQRNNAKNGAPTVVPAASQFKGWAPRQQGWQADRAN